MKQLFLTFLLVFMLASCTYVSERQNIKNCVFDLKNVKVTNVSLTGLSLQFDIDVENPNSGKVVLERFDYTAYADKEKLIEGSSPQKEEFISSQKKTVSILGNINFKDFRSGVREMLIKGSDVNYSLIGTVYLSTVFGEIPFGFKVHKKL